ncbi:MAG: ROK family protein [Bryobacteraceae bacterium]|jgi:glucokinase
MVVLGIHIGSDQMRAGMVDEKGAMLAARSVATPNELDGFCGALREALDWLIDASGTPGAVGVSCNGKIDRDSTRVEILPGSLHFLEGVALSDLVGMPLDVPVFADNDARVALAGEVVWGAARGRQDVVMLTLGAGVGGAVLSGGSMLRGHSGVAGQLGHLTVEPHGAVCSCGNRGCLETVFSARAIEGAAWSAVHRGCSSVLTSLFRGQPQLATCRTVFQAAAEGDEIARAIVTGALHRLVPAIVSLAHIFDPEVVILGGQAADAASDFLGDLREGVWERSRTLLGRDVPIIEAQVADKSGILSAAGLAIAPRS